MYDAQKGIDAQLLCPGFCSVYTYVYGLTVEPTASSAETRHFATRAVHRQMQAAPSYGLFFTPVGGLQHVEHVYRATHNKA